MTEQEYYLYLQSDAWHVLRDAVRVRDKLTCRACGNQQGAPTGVVGLRPARKKRRTRLVVHHLTYARVGRESLDDLILVCTICHHGMTHRDYGKFIEEASDKRGPRKPARYDRKQRWGRLKGDARTPREPDVASSATSVEERRVKALSAAADRWRFNYRK